MDRSACFDETGKYRYRLDRRWGRNRVKNITFIMLNPSTADAFQEDPTIRRCIGFAKRLEFPAMTVVNLFGLRATDPKALKHHMDPVGEDNDWYIYEAMLDSDVIVCAWGTHGSLRGRDKEALKYIRDMSYKMFHLGLTKGGHPKHPLYLPADSELQKFEVPAC